MNDYIVQYSIDVEQRFANDNTIEQRIIEALDKVGISVVGISWKATWTEQGYYKGEYPISD